MSEHCRSANSFVLLQEQLVYKAENATDSKIKLPSVGHVLRTIECYQNEQQINDSKLLLEFKHRTGSLYSQQYQHQYPTPSTTTPSPVSASVFSTDSQSQVHSTNTTPYEDSDHDSKSLVHSEGYQNPQPPSPSISAPPPPPPPQQQQQLQLQQQAAPSKVPITRSNKSRSNSSVTLDSRSSSMDSTANTDGENSISSVSSKSSSKKRTNLPKETIEILNEWILQNMDNPYPNHIQKKVLLAKTGLSNIQLSNWFINKRRRRIFSNLSGNNGQPIKKKRLIDRI